MADSKKTYQKKVLILILVFVLLRWIAAVSIELGNDESYYWLYSRHIQWNYFDHPPVIAVWIRFFTLNGWLDGYEGMVRAGSIISCAFSTWFLFKAVTLIKDEKAGWYAACLFNASLYTGIVAGVLVMPDAPQMFFWSLSLWLLAILITREKSWTIWILLGATAGLCVMSKVHGIFLWTGIILFILIKKQEWLRLPQLYMAMLLSAIIMSPIIFWNLEYDFMTWRFHSARVDIQQPDTMKDSFWVELGQQVLINNPFNFILILLAFVFFIKNKNIQPALVAYNFIALPLAIILIAVSLFRDIWFHWSGPAYTALLPAAAVYLRSVQQNDFPKWIRFSTAYFFIILIGWPLAIKHYPGTYGSKQANSLGYGDVSLDKYGWKESGKIFAELYENNQKEPGRAPIICPTWWGAHLEYYFGRPVNAQVIGLGNVQSLHHYAWLNSIRLHEADMDTAYFIRTTIEDTSSNLPFVDFYSRQELINTIPVYRKGKPAAYFHIHRLTGWKGNREGLAVQ